MTRSGKKRQKDGEQNNPGVAEGTRIRISRALQEFRETHNEGI